ncbi:MAG: porin [Planctomycetaceae bacterium]
MLNRVFCFSWPLILLLGLASPLAAQEPGQPAGDVSRLDALEQEVASLRQQLLNLPPAPITPARVANTAPAAPKYPTVALTGFLQADAGWVHQDAANLFAIGDAQDGADFRRARLAAKGDVAENVGYLVEFDFAFPGRPTFMDVWMEVRDTSLLGDVKIGQFRHPFGLDGLTSVKELTFIERGLPFAFLPFRQIGAMSSFANEDLGTTWAASGFRFPTDPFGGLTSDDGGYGMATRFTAVLWEDENDTVVHVGGAYSFIDPGTNPIRYRSAPEFFDAQANSVTLVTTSIPSFVDTGAMMANNTNLWAGELAATSGSFHAQSEVILSAVDRMAAPNTLFWGASAQAAYILTGEHRPYSRTSGVLGRITPTNNFGANGWGAFEVAGRWSILDLTDADIQGGVLNTATFGLNWYLNKFAKFQFNYVHAFLDSPVNRNSNADILGMRAQVDF